MESAVDKYRRATKVVAILDMGMRAVMLYIVYGSFWIFVILLRRSMKHDDFLHAWKTLVLEFIMAAIVVAIYVFEILGVIKLWKSTKSIPIALITSQARYWKIVAVCASLFYIFITILTFNFSAFTQDSEEEEKDESFTAISEITVYVIEVALKLVGVIIVTNYVDAVNTSLSLHAEEDLRLTDVVK